MGDSPLSQRALAVAPLLLGAHVRAHGVTVRLTEVEAYEGGDDPGSHAYRGLTARNAVMFGPAGSWYVYLSYGVHRCANIVCGPDGIASAILLRGGEVVDGVGTARERRTSGGRVPPDARLARGPGNLGRALGLDFADYGTPVDLTWPANPPDPASVRTGPRVGVSGPGGAADAHPWRFWLDGDPTVSGYRSGLSRVRAPSRR